MKARLFARFGPEAGREIEFGAEATIGRGPDNTLVLSAPEISQHHARIAFDGESSAYYLEDLDSLNGTRLDGGRVRGRERLGALHVLGLGEAVELFFQELERGPEAAAEPAGGRPAESTRVDADMPTLPIRLRRGQAGEETRVGVEAPTLPIGLRRKEERAEAGSATAVETAPAGLPEALASEAGSGGPPASPAPAASPFVLVVPGASPERFGLVEGENLVGRARDAAVRLRERELSRRHATLRVEGDRVWVRDEGSRNHTWVGRKKIHREVELSPGAELRFGAVAARLELAGEEAPDGGS